MCVSAGAGVVLCTLGRSEVNFVVSSFCFYVGPGIKPPRSFSISLALVCICCWFVLLCFCLFVLS